ncbi:putative serine/threonine protein phosphatase [Ceratobasidium sp. 423]|nr:putative serine/threonine protein phosphatase [Ceratobasidium sp. 423]
MGFDLDACIEQLLRKQLLHETLLREICEKTKEVLMRESNVVHVMAPVTVVGDIHGQFYDLIEIFRIGGYPPHTNYLFLGDYVDRGLFSVETISLLTCLKLRYPHRVQLVRGNHESRAVTQVRGSMLIHPYIPTCYSVHHLSVAYYPPNCPSHRIACTKKSYGFYTECVRKYGSSSVWTYFTDMFDYLTLSVVIEDRIFCVHGGLSLVLFAIESCIPRLCRLVLRYSRLFLRTLVKIVIASSLSPAYSPTLLAIGAYPHPALAHPIDASLDFMCLSPTIHSIDQIKVVDRFREIPHEGAMADLVWSDPDSEKEDFAISPRGAGYTFGSGVVRKFLETNNMHHILRAHQLCMEGFTVLFENRLSTVWSAPNYCYRCGNSASILEVGPGETMHFNVFEAAPENQTDGPSQQVVGGAVKLFPAHVANSSINLPPAGTETTPPKTVE